ncbi:MAG: STAS/SEC14 domain-containing protein [Gammaproteobacteria bacterium]|nr:STAS/SEC14 domain-containing protein [Gammaproteobacteria bacterium]
MIAHELRRDTGILIVTPQGPLEKSDFEMLAREVDPYIEEKGGLRGLMIQAKSFPGWHDFAALVSHFNFVKDHHRRIAKVAAVTDSGFLAILPSIANHFVQAEVRHFDYADKEKALKWLGSAI